MNGELHAMYVIANGEPYDGPIEDRDFTNDEGLHLAHGDVVGFDGEYAIVRRDLYAGLAKLNRVALARLRVGTEWRIETIVGSLPKTPRGHLVGGKRGDRAVLAAFYQVDR